MTVLETLGSFVAGAATASLPEAERDMQRRHFVDAMVAAAAGLRVEESVQMRPLFSDEAADQAGLIAASIRLTEIDDIHLSSCSTPSSAIAPVVTILAAEQPTLPPERIADALWVGTEALVRLAAAVDGPRILYRGIWPTYLATPFGAAAAAARLYGLDDTAVANALAIALTLTAGGAGRFAVGKTPRWFLHGQAVRSGILAARAAREGYAADADLLDRSWLQESHGLEFAPEALTDGLGEGSVYAELSMKPWCSAKQAIAATAAMRSLLDQGLRPEAIHAITVRVPPVYAGMIGAQANPNRRASTFASVRYQLALAAYAPSSLWDIERPDLPWSRDITAFMDKIAVEPDEELAAHYPCRWPGGVDVDAESGRVDAEIIAAPGDPSPQTRFDDTALFDKARRVLTPVLGGTKVTELLNLSASALVDPPAAEQLRSLLVAYTSDGIVRATGHEQAD